MVTRQQLKLLKARQKATQLKFTDFNISRLPTGQKVITRTRPFNLQEEKILKRLEKRR